MQVNGFSALSQRSALSGTSSTLGDEESFARSLAESEAEMSGATDINATSDSLLESFSSLWGSLSIESFLGFTPEDEGVVSISQLKAHGQQQLEEVNEELLALYREAGVDTSEEIALARDTGGVWRVSNGHKDTEAIESLLAENDDLTQRMSRAQAMLHLASVAEMTEPFRAAYEQDPQSAIARYNWIWNSRWSDTVIQAGGAISQRLTRAA